MDRRTMHLVKHYLLIIGGLNLGLWAIFGVDLIQTLFGASQLLVRFIYLLVGVSAVLNLITHKVNCKLCARRK